MTRLAILAIIALPACTPSSAFVIGHTHHGNPVHGAEFDEGAGIRGGGIAGTVGSVEVSASAYRQSVPGGGMGYTVAAAPADPWIALGPVNARPIGQINYYPEKPFGMLEETGGFFPSAGVSLRAELTEDVGVFCNAYPTSIRPDDNYTFEWLSVCGLSLEF